jgi:hypothetical protein
MSRKKKKKEELKYAQKSRGEEGLDEICSSRSIESGAPIFTR